MTAWMAPVGPPNPEQLDLARHPRSRRHGIRRAQHNELLRLRQLAGDEPTITSAELNNVRWVFHCRDLVQLPEAA
jgi:hypothetical protein